MLLKPTEAPQVHIELLPDTAIAVDVHADNDTFGITMWASAPPMPAVSGENLENFQENTCYDCQYHCETISVDVDGVEAYYGDDPVYLIGTAEANSPCSCYQEGINDVSWPCVAGHDEPDGEAEADDLNTKWLKYTYYPLDPYFEIALQGHSWDNNGCLLVSEETYQAINTYNSGDVCWGNNDTPNSLLGAYQTYTSAPANEDLCSFSTHEDNAYDAENDDCIVSLPNAFIPDNTRPAAIICASAQQSTSAYLLLATSGVAVDKTVAYTGVYLHRNVAIDADTVINVWATDVLPIGKRLLFAQTDSKDFDNAIYIGQVDSNFNLQPCESIQQQLSEPVALANS